MKLKQRFLLQFLVQFQLGDVLAGSRCDAYSRKFAVIGDAGSTDDSVINLRLFAWDDSGVLMQYLWDGSSWSWSPIGQ